MSLLEKINADLKESMKSGDKFRTETIRNLKSAIKYAEIEVGGMLDDAGVQAVLAKQAKQRRDSIAEFSKAGRTDLVDKEQAELALLEAYLPEQLTADKIKEMAQAVVTQLGVSDAKGMGLVMKELMPQLQGRADGKLVSQIVRELLAS
ncbi:MAG: putative protein YqeY [Anaerolineae bacterium]|nr:putative protein YqeY [Anaerolineae bacterium]